MPIQQSKKQSDVFFQKKENSAYLEKRLRLLHRQVYGQEFKTENKNLPNYKLQDASSSKDVTFLYQDLKKIFSLSALAIGIQVVLFILTRNHLLNLNLF